jgi:hypothetical protein
MFLCQTCGDKYLTSMGLSWPTSSMGPCEVCGKEAYCRDISSGWDWAWKPGDPSIDKTVKPDHNEKGKTDYGK